jgi:hypothetical protein
MTCGCTIGKLTEALGPAESLLEHMEFEEQEVWPLIADAQRALLSMDHARFRQVIAQGGTPNRYELEAHKELEDKLYAPIGIRHTDGNLDMHAAVTIETANPGKQGYDTGHTFVSKRTGDPVRVMARAGEDRNAAIQRVRARHNM